MIEENSVQCGPCCPWLQILLWDHGTAAHKCHMIWWHWKYLLWSRWRPPTSRKAQHRVSEGQRSHAHLTTLTQVCFLLPNNFQKEARLGPGYPVSSTEEWECLRSFSLCGNSTVTEGKNHMYVTKSSMMSQLRSQCSCYSSPRCFSDNVVFYEKAGDWRICQ